MIAPQWLKPLLINLLLLSYVLLAETSAAQAPDLSHLPAEEHDESHLLAREHVEGLHFAVGAGTELQRELEHNVTMMHRAELHLAASYMRSTDVYLEFGMGGSTLNFVPLVGKAYAIEHDCDWHSFMLARIAARNSTDFDRLSSLCVGVAPWTAGWGTRSSFEHADYSGPFRPYVDAIAGLGEASFDVVLVDGRARMACALRALEFIKDDGVVMMHDFYTRTMQYGGVLEYYDEVARVLAYDNKDSHYGPVGEPQGLVVLRRKPGAPKRLSASEIQAKYDAVDWRFPYGPPLTTLSGLFDFLILSSVDISRWKKPRNPETLVWFVFLDMCRLLCVYLLYVAWQRRRESRAKDVRRGAAIPLSMSSSAAKKQ